MSLCGTPATLPTSPRAWLVFLRWRSCIRSSGGMFRRETSGRLFSPVNSRRSSRNAASPACFAACGVENSPS